MSEKKSQKQYKQNISPIVKHDLCTQCGTCIGMCPTDAITLKQDPKKGLLPVVDENKCTDCGICLKVCPGEELDLNQMNRDLFGKVPDDELYGNYLNVYTAYAKNEEIRYNGASGGVATAILDALLKSGHITGAVVVRMSHERPLEPDVFVARNTEELISAQQSKYLPVPMNVAIKDILADKNGKYAIVGLPCHFHGLRLAENIKKRLKERIVLRMGLFCGFNPTLSSTKYLLRRAGVKDFDQIQNIKYRDGDWPCGFRAIMRDGSDHFLHPINEFLFAHYVFERRRCAMCCDQLNDLADLALGDEWRSDLKDDAGGWSHIMTRTEVGEECVRQMVEQGIIHVQESNAEHIFSGQRYTMIFKKRGNYAFGRIQRMLGKKIPNYLKTTNHKMKWQYWVGSFFVYLIPAMFENDVFSRMFVGMPTRVWNKYRNMILKLFRD